MAIKKDIEVLEIFAPSVDEAIFTSKEPVLEAMNLFAELVAIDFASWLIEHHWTNLMAKDNDKNIYLYQTGTTPKNRDYKTVRELYQEWIKLFK